MSFKSELMMPAKIRYDAEMNSIQKSDIEVFLESGESSQLATDSPGDDLVERIRGRDKTLREALLSEVNRLVPRNMRQDSSPTDENELGTWTNRKMEPMVSGLFPKTEHCAVLALLSQSAIFITHQSIDNLILGESWCHTAWEIANIYTRHYAGEAISETSLTLRRSTGSIELSYLESREINMAIQISDEFREHFNRFLATGDFQSEADVLRAAFRALEMHEADLTAIRQGLSDRH